MPAKSLVPCRHCQRLRSALRAKRGLCRACHADPKVRCRYPHSGTSLLRLGTGTPLQRDFAGPAPEPPPVPGLEPGSEAKKALLAQRAARGLELFPRKGEPVLPLRERALPYGVRYPAFWRVLASICPAVLDFLKPP